MHIRTENATRLWEGGGSAWLSSGQLKGEGNNWSGWYAAQMGVGTTCFITPENQDETLSSEDGCINHQLMPLSGEDEPFNQTSCLSLFEMRGFKYDGFAFCCF